MRSEDALERFESLLSSHGLTADQLTLDQGVSFALQFYRDFRADDCDIENDGDMMLFQWGNYDWRNGRFFEFNLTRQFMESDDIDPEIWQLSLTFTYELTQELEIFQSGNKWWSESLPAPLNTFEAFIRDSKAYKAVSSLVPEEIVLNFETV